jgi:phosphatidylcholine synthase
MVKLRVRRRRRTPSAPRERAAGSLQQILGWCVHGYTALGLVAAGMIAVLLVRGGPEAFRWSFLLMVAATVVDATDGTMARRVRIKEAVPSFDGRRLDDLIDFLTYTFLPLLLIWRAEILPAGCEPWLFLPLLASAYGFCQVQAKTDDGYFLGFPSLWNVVAVYLYALPFGAWISLAIVVVLAALTLVPSRYLYPSLPGTFNRIMTILAIPWTIALVWMIWNLPEHSGSKLGGLPLVGGWLSMVYPMFYLAASWAISLAHWRKRTRVPSPPERTW